MKKSRLAIFASGSGSNAEAIMKYFFHHPQIEIVLVLSNNERAYALERAKKYNVPSKIFTKTQLQNGEVNQWLKEVNITHLVLAGFLWLVPEIVVTTFPHRIINIHPSLLPKFGGKGMHGHKIHEAVVAAQETETGITMHEVNERYDEGKILAQVKCAVLPTDDATTLGERVLKLEHEHYPKVIEAWVTSSADRPR